MPKLSELHKFAALTTLGPSKFKELAKAADIVAPDHLKLIDDTTLLGVEIEVENIRDFRNSRYNYFWRVEEDNSLRDNGREFVTLPLKGDQVPFALVCLDSSLEDEARFSHRTSVHVHMNVRDLEPEQIAKIVLVYLTVEKFLFKFAGEHREKNIFCVPLYALEMTDTLFHSIMGLDKKEIRRIQSQEFRYSALNFEPMFSFGTIEFRHLGGTRDPHRIVSWINMLLRIKQYALSKDLQTLIRETIVLNSNSHYRGYAQEVFRELFWQVQSPNVDADIEAGVLSVKRTILSDGLMSELTNTPDFQQSPAGAVYKSIGTLLQKPNPANFVALDEIPPPQPVRGVGRDLAAFPFRAWIGDNENPWVNAQGSLPGAPGVVYAEDRISNYVVFTRGNPMRVGVGHELPSNFWEHSEADRRIIIAQRYQMRAL